MKITLLLFLICFTGVLAEAETTNQVFKVNCPICGYNQYLHPFKVDFSFRMEDAVNRVNQHSLWFHCGNTNIIPACTNEWSVLKEHRVQLQAIEVPPVLPVPPAHAMALVPIDPTTPAIVPSVPVKDMTFEELSQRWATNRQNLWIIETHKQP